MKATSEFIIPRNQILQKLKFSNMSMWINVDPAVVLSYFAPQPSDQLKKIRSGGTAATNQGDTT
jgi:hypothetical protein